VAVSSSTGWRFRSWDGFLVPKPLARIRIGYGAPVTVPRDLDREGLEAMAGELGHTLDALETRLAEDVG
jgi:hypothetical protein